MKRLLLVLLLGILAVTAYTFCKSWSLPDFPDSPQYRDGKFRYTRLKDGTVYAIYLPDAKESTLPKTLRIPGPAPAAGAQVTLLGNPGASLEWYLGLLIGPAVLHLLIAVTTAASLGRELEDGSLAAWDARDVGTLDQFDWRRFQQEYRDYIDLAKMAQMLPLIGAPVGMIVNYRLLDRLGETAINAYRMRWFEEREAAAAGRGD